MKKILFFILISSYSLFADALPVSTKTSVKAISDSTLELSTSIPAGMSGIVMHNYGNGLLAITHAVISLGGNRAAIQIDAAILHENIPSIQTDIIVGDMVIFGNFYNNTLLLAPNQIAYKQITSKFQRTWIHPDAFALDFMQEGETSLSMRYLKRFAKKNQIGLVLIVTSTELLVIDPISKKVIGRTALKTNPNTAMTPFYSRVKQMNIGVFNFSDKIFTPYFKSVAGLK